MSKLWPEVASIHVRLERAVHAVAVARPGSRLSIERGLSLQLPAKCLSALEVSGLLLSEQVPGLVSLVRGAGLVTALGGGPGALGEASTEAVLGVMALIVMGEISIGEIVRNLIFMKIKAYWAPLTVLHLAWQASPVMTFSYQCSRP